MRITMLVQNDWRHDSRVIREAECLARNGYQVTVFCRRISSSRTTETRNGVTYQIIPHRKTGYSLSDFFWLCLIHLRITAYDALRLTQARRRAGSLPAVAQLLAAACCVTLAVPVSLLLVPVLPLMRAWRNRFWIGRKLSVLQERARAALTNLAQPFPYLNDFAYQCFDDIVETKPDVVHAHDLVTLSAGFLAARRLKCPLIYDAHELETHTNYHSLSRATKYWIAKYEANLARWADAVITVCDSIADWLAREYSISRPCVCRNVPTHLGSIEARPTASNGLRTHLGLPPETPLVVYVGSVTVDRGLSLSVEAIAQLPGVHFATVGPRYAETETEIRAIAKSLGVSERVHLVDAVPSDQVVAFIASADCSLIAIQNVCLSYYFCFPNKLLESVMAGLPIAAASLFELKRFVEDHGVGLVMDETDPASIADTIRAILADRQRFKPTADQLDRIIKRYGWPTQEQALLQLYDQVLASRKRLAVPKDRADSPTFVAPNT